MAKMEGKGSLPYLQVRIMLIVYILLHLVYVQNYTKGMCVCINMHTNVFTHLVLRTPHKAGAVITHSISQGKIGTESLCNFIKVTQPVNAKPDRNPAGLTF